MPLTSLFKARSSAAVRKYMRVWHTYVDHSRLSDQVQLVLLLPSSLDRDPLVLEPDALFDFYVSMKLDAMLISIFLATLVLVDSGMSIFAL